MGGLARVVEQQRRQHQAVPDRPDRFAANGPHVRIKGFATGDRQEHGAEHHEPGARIVEEECNRLRRVEGGDDAGLAHDAPKPEHRDGDKPDEHDWTERPSDARRPAALHREQDHQNRQRFPADQGFCNQLTLHTQDHRRRQETPM